MSEIARPLRIALAQMNATVGDIDGNARKIREYLDRAVDEGAQLVVFPELAVNGYPPEDLLLKTHFLAAGRRALDEIAQHVRDTVALVGFAEHAEDVFNSLAVLADGRVQGIYRKMFLPNYGVFDEQRYFQSGDTAAIAQINGTTLGLTICEDIWEPGPPASDVALAGAEVIVNISASPYHRGKGGERERMLTQRARDSLAYVVYCNLVGGQDELVFDGYSLVIDQDGELMARGAQFEEELVVCDIDPSTADAARLRDARHRPAARVRRPSVAHIGVLPAPAHHESTEVGGPRAKPLEPDAEVYAALCLGLRDYVEKNAFQGVLFGLSGGIDSALTACVAVDALGADKVRCAVMPSPHSSVETQADARALADNLGIERYEFGLERLMGGYEEALREVFAGTEPGVAEENIQARIRGNLLMALSNKFGWLVLTTGNKSEYSVGYATLYGDMAGGFGVLKDVPKTLVYRLSHLRNTRGKPVIPMGIIERPPSAELKPGQQDSDSLPPYDLLDAILEAYVEQDQGREQLIRRGMPADVVDRVMRMVDAAEYKRRQAPPGIKITPRAFGRDRRLPITNRFKG
ncbi:MAG TPA: NAD+ synthase [Solirubrobacterales bacterium]|nr:NAD+ synthase [Solirubrobacterales bacterium]